MGVPSDHLHSSYTVHGWQGPSCSLSCPLPSSSLSCPGLLPPWAQMVLPQQSLEPWGPTGFSFPTGAAIGKEGLWAWAWPQPQRLLPSSAEVFSPSSLQGPGVYALASYQALVDTILAPFVSME